MSWLSRFFRRGSEEARLDQELRFHLDQRIADYLARGHNPQDARRLARLELGGIDQTKEACRDARGTRWLEDALHDIRYSLRILRQNPSFAAVALLTLGLGTGATTVMYSIINGVILKPFGYRDPGRLVQLQEQTDFSTLFGNLWSFTNPNYQDVKRETRSLDLTSFLIHRGTVSEPQPAEHQVGVDVESNFFSTVGVDIKLGRPFLPEDDKPGAQPVAIIGYDYWQQRYNASPSAVGSRLVFDGVAFTVVGVAPPNFKVGEVSLPIFTPLGQNPAPWLKQRNRHGLYVWGRLHPGANLDQARAELAVVGRRLAQQYPDSNKGRTFIANPLRADVDGSATLWMLLAAVGLVLLIACANIASLLLARAVSRDRELAMRAALGAGRGRLVRQCLTESAVLAIAGGIIGVLLAAVGVRPFLQFWPGQLQRIDEIALDWHVLLFAFAVSLFCGMLFGLAPALRAGARSLERSLRAGSRSIAGATRRLHGAFVAAEIALAVVLLISAGILARTWLRLAAMNNGLKTENVLTARTALSPKTLESPERTRAAWDDILDRLRRIPGVDAAATIDTIPLRQGSNQIGYRTSPASVPDDKQPNVLANCASPDYLKVMGIPLRSGRFLEARDRKGAESVVVIDEDMARQAFPGEDPIGKHLWIGIGPDPATVVGVVGHVRQWGASDDDARQVRAQLYYPFAQVPDNLVRRWSDLMSIALRTRTDPLGLVEPIRREVRGATGDQVIYEIRTMDQLAASAIAQQRFLVLLFSIFAGLALLLACIGIYGVLAYLTGQRTSEIGVRMALGAGAREVMWMVLRQSLAMIAIGLAIGIAGAIAAGRTLMRLVEGVRQIDASTFAVMAAIFVATALLASFLPARRARRIDPLSALRQD